MKTYLLFLVFCLTSVFEIRSQNDTSVTTKRNAVYVELLGNAGLYSFNYERQIARQRNNYFNLRLGAAYLWWREARTPVFVVEPIYLKGGKNHFLELSISATFFSSRKIFAPEANPPKEIRASFMPRIGYRYQSPNKSLLFRFGVMPIILTQGRFLPMITRWYIPMLGLSLGKQF
ncbi:MAG: hypothetical protein EAZ32_12870 [Cytophagia bacterium]|nr:MAG: hypothetical protein EAZ46_07870 [Runella sp.]TAG18728.1 MAG: hypothetical protein EAZ38_14115 [Cytophagales bacterium]TAG38263.1 MAG: hypothetical protein EAZ32_12870 [Cytophagia bacterium]TAG79672.1 MAG: hypothetical protein EAZ22_11095 [Cytophagales bacterium]